MRARGRTDGNRTRTRETDGNRQQATGTNRHQQATGKKPKKTDGETQNRPPTPQKKFVFLRGSALAKWDSTQTVLLSDIKILIFVLKYFTT